MPAGLTGLDQHDPCAGLLRAVLRHIAVHSELEVALSGCQAAERVLQPDHICVADDHVVPLGQQLLQHSHPASSAHFDTLSCRASLPFSVYLIHSNDVCATINVVGSQ